MAPMPRYGDFNAKPKGFGTWHAESKIYSFVIKSLCHFFLDKLDSSPRGSIDARKPLNLNIEPSIREG